MELLTEPSLTLVRSLAWWQWLLALLAVIVSGVSKAGLKGMAVVVVTLFALVFGGKASTGILVPLLIVADILAVRYYHRHAQAKHLKKVLPWVLVGIILGVWLGKDLSEEIFKQVMAVIILISLGVLYLFSNKKDTSIPEHWAFAGAMGLVAGFATMVGNLAGAFVTIYFLAMRMPKNNFIGTAAWLFLIINVFKVPFHIFVWKTMSWETLSLNLILFPGILLGFYLGVKLIKNLQEQHYRKLIIVLTALGALAIFLR